MRESVDRRVLGAFRCLDKVTGTSVLNKLAVDASPMSVRPNRSGIYVIFAAPGFNDFTDRFDPPPPATDPMGFEISIQDPRRRYLPRRVTVQVPEKLPPAIDPSQPFDPAKVLSDSLVVFNPQQVALFPSPAATLSPNWAVIHVSVVRSGVVPPKGLPWSAVQVSRTDNNKVLAATVTDDRGEGLLAIPGLGPEVSGSETGAVTNSNLKVTITAGFDPSVADPLPAAWIPDPDDLFKKLTAGSLKTGTLADEIAPGQRLNRTLQITV